jgi:hypothetical protein
MRPEESLHWAQRSLDFAFDCGATAVTLIPTRGGNGAMESLAQSGEFTLPAISTVEQAARLWCEPGARAGVCRSLGYAESTGHLPALLGGSCDTISAHESSPAKHCCRTLLTLRGAELTRNYDIAVFGSGFAGSLIAMIAKRQGYSVVMLERGKHPRMTIGESSTPLANLLLDELATRYDLPAIRPLAKWGSWQRAYPHIGCGLKRGFTFYQHEAGKPDAPDPDHVRQLLVAASPHDEIADTHWYRPDFDLFLVNQAQALGVDYIDEASTERLLELEDGLSFDVVRKEETKEFRARFAIDATGPRGLMHRAFHLA